MKKVSFQKSASALTSESTKARSGAPENTKGAQAVKRGRAGMITLLAAAALSLYALAGIVAARAEIERYSQTREALSARAQELEEANAGLEELLRQGRADRDSVIEELARERLGLVYPDAVSYTHLTLPTN